MGIKLTQDFTKNSAVAGDPITRELLHSLPKCELHCHLDGSMRVETVLELAQQQGVQLPASEPAALREILVQDEAMSLVNYLKAFDITLSVLQEASALRRVAYELIEDAHKDNVIYVEVRYAPILHQRKGLKLTQIVESVLDGLRQGQRDFGVRWGLIICGMRSNHPKYTRQMAELCIAYKNQGVVGFDLAGAEGGNPAADHADAFQLILQNNINVTIHAGEAYGPPSIEQALHHCGAHRLGHAVRLKEDGDLLNYCNDHRIPLEICLTSNVQTGAISELSFHPLRFYYDYGMRVCICTDNTLMSGVTVTDELWKAHTVLDFTLPELKNIVLYSFKSAFLPQRQKVELIDEVLDRLNAIQAKSATPCTTNAPMDTPTEKLTAK
ncbi:MAG: adenosine deaminase [Candidatus Sumerlaeia bacterium]|nr:adenosine deaminase [Candidatus Sumerlaeia bacterium]